MTAGAYPRLFSPLELAGARLRNRIVHVATVTNLGHAHGIGEPLIAHLRARAAGGAAMIVSEGLGVDSGSVPNPHVVSLSEAANRDGLARLAEAVEGEGCRLLGQLWHVGRQQLWSAATTPLGVSHLPDPLSWSVPHVMDIGDIERLEAAFVAAARVLRDAGFSGAELHGAHGYLITQFLSPACNLRDDAYGGDRDRRLRFLRRVIAGIREDCGAGFVLGLKMPADEGVEGGIDLDEARAITAALAADGGLDYIAYSQGNFSLSLEKHLPDMHFPPAPYASLAAALKPAAGEMKVMVLGRVMNAAHGEALIAETGAELVGMSRPLLADPALPDKAAAGREDDIRPCTHCNFCWGEIHAGRPLRCAQNVRLGEPGDGGPWIAPAPATRRLTVVGAGLAGLEAAWLAAAAGHRVVLFGASAAAGGKARLESLLPGRRQAGSAIAFQERQLERYRVECRLGARADVDAVLATAPDAVLLATGATPLAPELAEDSEAMVALVDAIPALVAEGERIAGTAVLFDQDQTAPVYAAAELLAARYDRVMVVTPATQIARAVPYVSAIGVHRRLFAAGIELVVASRPLWYREHAVMIENVFTGARRELGEVALAVYATPRRADDALAAPLRDRGLAPRLIGDCHAPRNALAAMREARDWAQAQ